MSTTTTTRTVPFVLAKKSSVIIKSSNFDRLARLLADAQEGLSARTLDAADLMYAADQAEARLRALAPEQRVGATAVYDPHSVPSSYGHGAHGTTVTMERRATGWAVVEVTRDWTRTTSGGARPSDAVALKVKLAPWSDPKELLARFMKDAGVTL